MGRLKSCGRAEEVLTWPVEAEVATISYSELKARNETL